MNRIVTGMMAVVALAASAGTAQAEVFRYRTRGHSADFSTYSESECGYQAVAVYAFESLEKTGGGGGTSFEGAYLDFYAYDFCTGDSSYGFTFIEGAGIDINRLQSASVDAAGEMTVVHYSYEGAVEAGRGQCGGGGGGSGGSGGEEPVFEEVVVPFSVSLDWTGTGDTYRSRYMSSWSGPTGQSRYSASGSSREASVTGAVDIDAISFDVSAGYGNLAQSNSGAFEQYR